MKLDNDPAAQQRSEIENDLWAALESLKKKTVKGRPARISFSAVALEAGRSRTLIGHADCPYKDVRDAVSAAIDAQKQRKDPTGTTLPLGASKRIQAPPANMLESPNPDSIITELEQEIAYLKRQIKVAAIKIVTIDDENQQLREAVKRLETKLARRG